MKKEAYYFKHDSNAQNDPKIKQMRSVYGIEGYGLYWAFVELMRDQEGYKLPISGKYAIKAYAEDFKVDPVRLQEYIEDCVSEFNLFETDGEYLWSRSLIRRMQNYEDICNKNREAVMRRWANQRNTSVLPAQSDCNTNKEEENREEEIKEDKNKNTYGEFKNVALTQNEYKKLTERFGEIGAADKIEELSQALQSRRGYPQKYKDHYATILRWNRRDEKGGSNGFTGTSGSHETAGGQKSQAPPPVAYGSRRRKNQGDSTADLERFANS